jgi:hypothetical protein
MQGMESLPPPPIPPRPDPPDEPRPPRSRPWVAGIVGLLVLSVVAAAVIPSSGSEPSGGVVNTALAPPGSIEDVHEAVRRISSATGIPFAYDGVTDERPSRFRDPFQPERYGERWAPILIAWADPNTSDIPFEGQNHIASAVASPLYPNRSVEDVYVSGWIVLNAEDPNPPGFDTVGAQGPVLLHEFGHVMGLAHVGRWGELMQEAGGGRVDLGSGDREGLRRLGAGGGCVRVPPAQP